MKNLRNLLSLILTLSMALALCAVPAHAAGTQKPVVGPSAITIKEGEAPEDGLTVTLSVAQPISNAITAGCTITLPEGCTFAYEPDVAGTLDSRGRYKALGTVFEWPEEETNVAALTWIDMNGVEIDPSKFVNMDKEPVDAWFTFTIDGADTLPVGNYEIKFTNINVASMDEDVITNATASIPLRVEYDGAPLALTGVCRKSANAATVSVVTTQPVTLSNYDVTLTWDKTLFNLTGITNGQPSLMTAFQKNTTTGRTSAASGNNVTIPAGATLATYTLSAKTTPKKGDVYDFSLLVRDVADENGDPLPWKGLTVDGKIPVALPLSFDCRAPQAFTLNDTTPAAGDFTVESATPCIVLYSNGSGYQKMEASLVSGNTYSFTVPDDYDDSTKIVVAVKGDFSADGEITSTDANQVLRCSAGNRSYDQVTMLICDINGDGELTSTDANQLLRVSTELRTLAW